MARSRFTKLSITVVALVIGAGLATAALSCGFHNYEPKQTMSDILLTSDEIVLARTDPNDPFRFKAFKALQGSVSSTDIPHLVGGNTRKQFVVDSNAAVLFARSGANGSWKRVALIDAAMAPVLKTIMSRLPKWRLGMEDDRYAYFATLVGHPSDQIHKIAMRELDKASYATLRQLKVNVPPERLLAPLEDPNESELKAIRILLLGVTGNNDAGQLMEDGIARSASAKGALLGAYATAFIEIAGPEAVETLTTNYLINPSVPLYTRELMLEAFALHSQTGNLTLETIITQTIETALWIEPGLAPAVARQFGGNVGVKNNWKFETTLKLVFDTEKWLSVSDKLAVANYLFSAQIAK